MTLPGHIDPLRSNLMNDQVNTVRIPRRSKYDFAAEKIFSNVLFSIKIIFNVTTVLDNQ